VPGIAAVAGDDRVIIDSPAAIGHGWSVYAFTGSPTAAAPAAADEVVADVRLGVTPGQRLTLTVAGRPASYRVRGTVDTGDAQVFFTDARAAQLSAHPGRYDAIGDRRRPGRRSPRPGGIATAAGASHTRAGTGASAEQSAGLAARGLLIEAGSAFGGYVVLLVVFVVAGTIGLSVRHRRRDLALLRAVAATPGQLRRMLMAESALLGLAGAVLGVPAGWSPPAGCAASSFGRGFIPAGLPAGARLDRRRGPPPSSRCWWRLLAALIAGRRVTRIKPVEALGRGRRRAAAQRAGAAGVRPRHAGRRGWSAAGSRPRSPAPRRRWPARWGCCICS
jgi:putative ABC transport system permease protein